MKTQSKWVVAGGAAAFVLTPVIAFAGPSALDREINGSGVVVQATAASTAPTAQPASPAAQPGGDRAAQQTAVSPVSAGSRQVVSAATPVSPQSATPPAGSDDRVAKASASPVSPISPTSPQSPKSPKSPRMAASPNTP